MIVTDLIGEGRCYVLFFVANQAGETPDGVLDAHGQERPPAGRTRLGKVLCAANHNAIWRIPVQHAQIKGSDTLQRVSWAIGVENAQRAEVFSRRTLGEFEDASAAIVLRQIDRAFEGADIRMGADPGGPGGERRTQFRRYVVSVDQHDPQQLDRLGDALGALIEAVAASKEDFLVKAAERDGFVFAHGVFRPAVTAPSSFAVTRVEDLAFIDDRGRRLHLLANDSPKDAIGGAKELVESVCRTVLRLIGEPVPGKTADLVDYRQIDAQGPRARSGRHRRCEKGRRPRP